MPSSFSRRLSALCAALVFAVVGLTAPALSGAADQPRPEPSLKIKGLRAHGFPDVRHRPQTRRGTQRDNTGTSGAPHNALGQICRPASGSNPAYCPQPPLNFHSGRGVQHRPRVHMIFWGSNWNTTGASLRSQLLTMFNDFRGSAYQEVLTQYYDETGFITDDVQIDSTTLTSVSAPTNVDDAALRATVTTAIQATGWSRTQDSQFFVLPAPGTSYAAGFGGVAGYCGYHGFDSQDSAYAFVPYQADPAFASYCLGWDPGLDAAHVTTMLAAHEYTETVTDPYLDSWYTADGYEIADICQSGEDPLPDGFYAQGIWDNSRGVCSMGGAALPSSAAQFGTAGSGSGQLATPNGVDVDAAGNVWVVDQGNNRVQKFSAGGAFLASYGTLGSGAGQFNGPRDIAINRSTGDIYITDYNNSRVVQLSSTGTQVRTFGTSGSGNGQFSLPAGLTLDAAGNVWVADSGNSRIQEFSSTGTFIKTQTMSYQPNDIAFSGGDLYVLDFGGSKIYQYTTAGAQVRSFGSPGTGAGQLSSPTRISANAAGDLYVSEFAGNRVQAFSPTGTPLMTFGGGALSAPRGAVVTANGTIYVADSGNNRIARYVGPRRPGVVGGQFAGTGSGSGQFSTPNGLDFDAAGNVWIVDQGNNRVQKFSAGGAFLASYGSLGSGAGQFNSPRDIAINRSTGDSYISDWTNNRVVQLSSTGTQVRTFGTSGTGNGQFSGPTGIALDGSGNVWVADPNNNRVEEFSSTGTFIKTQTMSYQPNDIAFSGGDLYVLDFGGSKIYEYTTAGTQVRTFGSPGTGTGQLSSPTRIAADAAGDLYVSEYNGSRVQVFSPTGTPLTSFGDVGIVPRGLAVAKDGTVYVADEHMGSVDLFTASPADRGLSASFGSAGSGSGQFSTPNGLDFDGSGNVWVVDQGNNRVQKFGPGGAFLASYGTLGSGAGQFNSPRDIAINRSTGSVYISDWANNRVVQLSSTGTQVRTFGTSGTGNGQFAGPTGITVDASGNVWVADPNNNRFQEFTSTGTFMRLLTTPYQPNDIAVFGQTVYSVDYAGDTVNYYGLAGLSWNGGFSSPSSGPATLHSPTRIAVDASGNVYVSEFNGGRVHEYTPFGNTLATFGESTLSSPRGLAVAGDGRVYVADGAHSRITRWGN